MNEFNNLEEFEEHEYEKENKFFIETISNTVYFSLANNEPKDIQDKNYYSNFDDFLENPYYNDLDADLLKGDLDAVNDFEDEDDNFNEDENLELDQEFNNDNEQFEKEYQSLSQEFQLSSSQESENKLNLNLITTFTFASKLSNSQSNSQSSQTEINK